MKIKISMPPVAISHVSSLPPSRGPAGDFVKHQPPRDIDSSSLGLWNRICENPLPREIAGWLDVAGMPDYSGYAEHFSRIGDFTNSVSYLAASSLFFTAYMYDNGGMVDNPLTPGVKIPKFEMKDLKKMSQTYTDQFLKYVSEAHQLKYSRIQEALEPVFWYLPDLSNLSNVGNTAKPDEFLLEMRQALELGKYSYLMDLFPSDPEVPSAFFQKDVTRMRLEIEMYWNKPVAPRDLAIMIDGIPRVLPRKIARPPANGNGHRELYPFAKNNRSFRAYCNDFGKIPLLSNDGEIEIAKSIESAFVDLGRQVFSTSEGIKLLLEYADGLPEDGIPNVILDQKENDLDEGKKQALRTGFFGSIAEIRGAGKMGKALEYAEKIKLTNLFICAIADETLKRIAPDAEAAIRIKTAGSAADKEIGKLVEPNLRLVISIAKQYPRPGVEFMDLVQEGNLGLMKAAIKYNHRLGYKFITYAGCWIREAFLRGGDDLSRIIRVQPHLNYSIMRLRSEISSCEKRGITPTPENLAKQMAVPVDAVDNLLQVMALNDLASLDAPQKNNNGTTDSLLETIGDAAAADPGSSLDSLRRDDLVERAIITLDRRELYIIQQRFLAEEIKSLQEIGDVLGVSRERIRQLEARAIGKIRSRLGIE